MNSRKIVIIGGGVGGYVAAIRGSQLGAQVTLVEKDRLGGLCLNKGCIPSKVLLQSANILKQTKDAAIFGISAENISVDFSAVMNRKEAIVEQLANNIAYLMRKNKIGVIEGVGMLIDTNTVGILGGDRRIEAENIIIATGSKPVMIPIEGIGDCGVLTSDDMVKLRKLPNSIVIIGGGVYGLEFAQIMSRMGSKVTIVEVMPQVLPGIDTEVANILNSILLDEGIEIFTQAKVSGIKKEEKGKVISFAVNGDMREITCDDVMVAVERRPNIDDLGIEKLGIAVTSKGNSIIVNKKRETNIPGVYAVGDVIGEPMLSHVAMVEGRCAAENIMGADCELDTSATPACVFTSPEVASVGLSELEATEEYGAIKIGRFPFASNARALILNQTNGIVKIIADAKHGQILGVHIVGPHASELIAEAVPLMRLEATLEEVFCTIHAHPTLSEAMLEGALNAEGRAIHL